MPGRNARGVPGFRKLQIVELLGVPEERWHQTVIPVTISVSSRRQPVDGVARADGCPCRADMACNVGNFSALSDVATSKFFHQRCSIQTQKFGSAVFVSAGTFKRLAYELVLQLGKQEPQINT